MQKHLSPFERQCACNFGVQDLFRCDAGQAPQHRVGHGEHSVQAVDLQVALPHIVRCGRKHRHQSPVAQHHSTRVVDHKTGLKVQARKVRIGLVGVARQEDRVGPRQLAHGRVLWASHRPGSAFGPCGQRVAQWVTAGKVFRQHHQPDIRADEGFGSANLSAHTRDVVEHQRPRTGHIGRAVDGVAGALQRQRRVGFGVG